MASLTEDQQRGFGDRITEIYGKPETATAVAASDKGLDLTKRKTALGGRKPRRPQRKAIKRRQRLLGPTRPSYRSPPPTRITKRRAAPPKRSSPSWVKTMHSANRSVVCAEEW